PIADTPSNKPFVAAVNAVHHSAGSTSVASGCSARPLRTTAPVRASHTTTLVDCVDESTPATSTSLSVMPQSLLAATRPRPRSKQLSIVLGDLRTTFSGLTAVREPRLAG